LIGSVVYGLRVAGIVFFIFGETVPGVRVGEGRGDVNSGKHIERVKEIVGVAG